MTSILSLVSFLVIFMVVSGPVVAAAAPGHLESVTMLAAGAGSSLAVRTSAISVLVATTAADPRTVMIDLVGIGGDRRDMTVSGRPGMISRIAIDTASSSGGGTITRIRVSLTSGYRHGLRTFGNLVYVDFQPLGEAESNSTRAETGTTRTPEPQFVAAAVHERGPVNAAVSDTAVAKEQPSTFSTTPVNLASRWMAIMEPLQHLLKAPPPATTTSREWIPLVLKDRTIVFSHGDYAAVNEQLTLLLPFDDEDPPRVEPVSLPNSVLDLDATTRAAESVRAARYAATRGPRDFADFSEEVSAVLDAVPMETDPVARVALLEQVIRRLVEWPAAHLGYRAPEINEAVATAALILNQFRAAAGMNRVDLTLTASTVAPVPAFPFHQPALVDLIEAAMRVAAFLTLPAERTAVLRATADSLQRHRATLPARWFANTQPRVTAALTDESRVDEAYRKLIVDLVSRGVRAGREGNVRAIAELQSDLSKGDRRLGEKRQDVVISAMAALQAQFEIAARAQLDRDRGALEIESGRTYTDCIAPALNRFRSARQDLQQLVSSSMPSKMQGVRETLEFVDRVLARCIPPLQFEGAHRLMLNAAQLAALAIKEPVSHLRERATAESLTMFEEGRMAIEKPPPPSHAGKPARK